MKHYPGEKSSAIHDASLSNAPMMTDDVIHLGSPSMFPNPVATISREITLPSGLSEPKSPVTCTLPANLAVFSYKDTLSPQLLLLGDSIVKEIRLPEAITYSLSDGKVSDFVLLLPKLLDLHPSIKTVIVHAGANDVMGRQSAKLYQDFENLCFKADSLGKQLIISGPIPLPSRGCEFFSRLFGLHIWLKHFCTAAGFNFIGNFDYFWTRHDLFGKNGLHPNRDGVKKLTFILLNYMAFGIH